MVEETAWSTDEEVHALGQLFCFRLPVCSTHHDCESLVVMLAQFFRHTEDLEGEFSRR